MCTGSGMLGFFRNASCHSIDQQMKLDLDSGCRGFGNICNLKHANRTVQMSPTSGISSLEVFRNGANSRTFQERATLLVG
jgi:hypothetical protein